MRTSELKKHYLSKDFWKNPDNQFWNTEMYSEEAKKKIEKALLK